MSDKSYEEKLQIAKEAYRQIKAAIEHFESQGLHYCAHWDGCISVEEEFFTERQLIDQD